MPDGFSVDASSLDKLAEKLLRAAVEGEREADRALILIGERHAQEAKAILAGKSTSIPPTIKSEPLPAQHAVRVTAVGSALAWAYERGNKDKGRAQGFDAQDSREWFGHPVFAKKGDPRYDDRGEWAEQPRHPFFSRARSQLRRWTTSTITEGWTRGLRNSGIKVD